MSRLISFWSDIPQGTRVTVRRPGGERFKTVTIGKPQPGGDGSGFILVATIARPVPLERVSLGWEEPRPGAGIPFAAVLDPPPIAATLGDRFVSIALAAALLYFMATGGFAFAVWVLR